MNYHPQDFINLSLQVEREGGTLLPEPCIGERIKYRLPSAKGGFRWERRWTAHCNEAARMEIPYDPRLQVRLRDDAEDDVFVIDHPGETLKDPPKLPRVTACAVDDAIGLWPRFNASLSKKSYQP